MILAFLLFLALEALWYLLKNSLRLKFGRIASFALVVHDALADDSWLVGEPVRRGISACIITKDAGKTIERCLRSLEGAVDEIVVVDSGSGDDTLEICQRYTDKVYRTRFEGNFADLRNQAAAHASGPWILALDADETRAWASHWKFKRLLIVTSGYHMPRALAELARVMPEATLVPYPVASPNLQLETWWFHPRSSWLIVREYLKFLNAYGRLVIGRWV